MGGPKAVRDEHRNRVGSAGRIGHVHSGARRTAEISARRPRDDLPIGIGISRISAHTGHRHIDVCAMVGKGDGTAQACRSRKGSRRRKVRGTAGLGQLHCDRIVRTRCQTR